MLSSALTPLLEGSRPQVSSELVCALSLSTGKLPAVSRMKMCARFQPDPSASFTEENSMALSA